MEEIPGELCEYFKFSSSHNFKMPEETINFSHVFYITININYYFKENYFTKYMQKLQHILNIKIISELSVSFSYEAFETHTYSTPV
jgi:hypothetical protein